MSRYGPKPMPAIERLMARVVETPGPLETACWITNYSITRNGYAQMQMPAPLTRPRNCHRVAYEALVGPIPDGLVLDHLCRVRTCCNPAHLEPVTQRENWLRGMAPSAISTRTNLCIRGHPLHLARDGTRRCSTCHRQHGLARRARLAAITSQ